MNDSRETGLTNQANRASNPLMKKVAVVAAAGTMAVGGYLSAKGAENVGERIGSMENPAALVTDPAEAAVNFVDGRIDAIQGAEDLKQQTTLTPEQQRDIIQRGEAAKS